MHKDGETHKSCATVGRKYGGIPNGAHPKVVEVNLKFVT